ncbi:uncharacterized protein LOC120692477 [Panicum virgatum]|uniref:Rx N-terminal domain-containing protein n=1 Tax=Panicum virgatum TaxID=38727 RepID=A0A8T0MQ48_PANVG|nr:uncharacterized protein LOC120692477 [Panicum virgatum]KAG2538808.1 hypothetical protein PVAP13_9NG346700 [Panicum virgatum]
MDLASSAVASDLASRFISFLIHRFSTGSCPEEKVEKLQHLLQRVETVVEEADGRYITNSGMLSQLRMLEDAMYRGYHALHNFNYGGFEGPGKVGRKGSLSSLYFATPLKRFHRSGSGDAIPCSGQELQSALASLEAAVANMTEFVILLGGCERMSRRPYDTYLYMENFMFGRHAEKQQAINILLQPSPLNNSAPTVLPIVGGHLVGKKTLVAHVCGDERVRAHFSNILHLNSDNLQIVDHERYISERALVIVELTADIRDEDWMKFYSVVSRMGQGSKVILITRLENLSRFGTVKPVCLNSLSYEEYSYLFKVLSFGSTNMDDHPRLASMVQEFPLLLRGSLISVYAFADMLKKNMSAQFWASVLDRFRAVVDSNLCIFGEHPKLLLERDRPTDIARFISPSTPSLRLMPPRSKADTQERPLPMLTFAELMVDPRILPKGDFDLVTWKSKIAPYGEYVHFVLADHAEQQPEGLPTRRKRPAVFL